MMVIENKDGVTDWNGQDFLELELGPVYLRLGSDNGPPLLEGSLGASR